MTQSSFEKLRFANSLPARLALPIVPPGGAVFPDNFDVGRTSVVCKILLCQVWYTTPKRIHGLLHYDGPSQLFFVGYECGKCGEVFLVPDTVEDERLLVFAMRHGCTDPPQ
jgi:hypothetical protein